MGVRRTDNAALRTVTLASSDPTPALLGAACLAALADRPEGSAAGLELRNCCIAEPRLRRATGRLRAPAAREETGGLGGLTRLAGLLKCRRRPAGGGAQLRQPSAPAVPPAAGCAPASPCHRVEPRCPPRSSASAAGARWSPGPVDWPHRIIHRYPSMPMNRTAPAHPTLTTSRPQGRSSTTPLAWSPQRSASRRPPTPQPGIGRRVGGNGEPAVGGDPPTALGAGLVELDLNLRCSGHRDQHQPRSGDRPRPSAAVNVLDVERTSFVRPLGCHRTPPFARLRWSLRRVGRGCSSAGGGLLLTSARRHQELACPPEEPWPPSPRVVYQPGRPRRTTPRPFNSGSSTRWTSNWAIRSPADRDGLAGVEIDQRHLDLAAVAGVDGAGAIDDRKSNTRGQTGSRVHQPTMPCGIATAIPVATSARWPGGSSRSSALNRSTPASPSWARLGIGQIGSNERPQDGWTRSAQTTPGWA